MVNVTQNSYDSFAKLYDKKNLESLANAYYERPAIISLLPADLKYKFIVDAGCGSGLFGQYIEQQGAKLLAFDYSKELIKIAKTRLKTSKIFIANLEEKLDFIETNSVDIIISSLVLHYIENWDPIFTEFDRILRKDGIIIFSIHHPHQDWHWLNLKSYFEKVKCDDDWDLEGKKFHIQYYHRTLMEIFNIINQTNFYVEKLLEPLPIAEGEKIDPKFYETLNTRPSFLLFRLKKIVKCA